MFEMTVAMFEMTGGSFKKALAQVTRGAVQFPGPLLGKLSIHSDIEEQYNFSPVM